MGTMLQFLGTMTKDKEMGKKYGSSNSAGRRAMYRSFQGGGSSASKPTASTGSTAGSTTGSTAPKAKKRTAGTYSAGSLGRPSTSSRGLSS